MKKTKVYIKTNEKNEVVEIISSQFLKDTKGYELLDEGVGDRFVHAQSMYLRNGLQDSQGRSNYKFIKGKLRELTEDEKTKVQTEEEATQEQNVQEQRIEKLEKIVTKLLEVFEIDITDFEE